MKALPAGLSLPSQSVSSQPPMLGRVSRNVVWNLLGQASPLVVAVLAIPTLVHTLGVERFGILTLAWVIIGYFSIFDFGLGRALTQTVARRIGAEQGTAMDLIIWSGLSSMLLLGILAAICFALLTPWIGHTILKIPSKLQTESIRAFYLLAATLPIVITNAGLRGLLEAHQRFAIINAIRIPQGVFSYAGPLLILPLSRSLVAVVGTLAVGRALSWIAYAAACRRLIPTFNMRVSIDRQAIRELFGLGGWMTVSNIISPILAYADRFLIGGIASVLAVAYYATPYDVATRLLVVPSAVAGVLFPTFALSLVRDRQQAIRLFTRSVEYLALGLSPLIVLAVVFAPESLRFWLGPDFARHSGTVLQLLAIGVFANSISFVPFALVQGAGRPDLTGRLHLVELSIYLPFLLVMLHVLGIEGVALAWLLRVWIDAIMLFFFASRQLPLDNGTRHIVGFALVMPVLLLPGLFPRQAALRAVLELPALIAMFLAMRRFSTGARVLTLVGRRLGDRTSRGFIDAT